VRSESGFNRLLVFGLYNKYVVCAQSAPLARAWHRGVLCVLLPQGTLSQVPVLSYVFTAPMEPCHKYLSCAVSLRFGSVGPVLGFTSGFPSDLRELDGGFEGLGLGFRV
jgi:hypothetical protein